MFIVWILLVYVRLKEFVILLAFPILIPLYLFSYLSKTVRLYLRIKLLKVPLDQIIFGNFDEITGASLFRDEISFGFERPVVDLLHKLHCERWASPGEIAIVTLEEGIPSKLGPLHESPEFLLVIEVLRAIGEDSIATEEGGHGELDTIYFGQVSV